MRHLKKLYHHLFNRVTPQSVIYPIDEAFHHLIDVIRWSRPHSCHDNDLSAWENMLNDVIVQQLEHHPNFDQEQFKKLCQS